MQLCRRQQSHKQKGAERCRAGLGADHQKRADRRHAGQLSPGQAGAAQQHPRQHKAEHHPAEGVGVTVTEHQAEAAVALTGGIGSNNARKVQKLHQHQRGKAAGQQRLHAAAQRYILCGQQGNAKPQPPDILPVEVDPPRHKIQRTGAEQAAPAVPCAEQNLAPEA